MCPMFSMCECPTSTHHMVTFIELYSSLVAKLVLQGGRGLGVDSF